MSVYTCLRDILNAADLPNTGPDVWPGSGLAHRLDRVPDFADRWSRGWIPQKTILKDTEGIM